MEHVEVARAETERGELVLRERLGGDGATGALELRANGLFVMDTVEVGTERALATAALDLVNRPHDVVVGGLGLGFTVREVLADARVEKCAVVEIEQALVDWMRDGTIPHGTALLADRRVSLVVADIARALAAAPAASYDLALLDVDNGPEHLVHASNAALYDVPFLTAVERVLRPGGCLVIWSADRSPDLASALRSAFGSAREHVCPVDLQGRAVDYYLYLATAG